MDKIVLQLYVRANTHKAKVYKKPCTKIGRVACHDTPESTIAKLTTDVRPSPRHSATAWHASSALRSRIRRICQSLLVTGFIDITLDLVSAGFLVEHAGYSDVERIDPSLMSSGLTKPATPMAATITSARRMCSRTSLVPVWHSVTVALTALRVNNRPMVRPMVMPRPSTHTSLPSKSMS